MTANPDTELAITLPGNEDSRWNKTEMKLKRLEKRLKKTLPKKRQKELGI